MMTNPPSHEPDAELAIEAGAAFAVLCPQCGTEVTIPVGAELAGEPPQRYIVLEPDLTDVWEHAKACLCPSR